MAEIYYSRLEFLLIFGEKATCIFTLSEVVAAFSVLVKHVKLCIDAIEEVGYFYLYIFFFYTDTQIYWS
jgi:hypothetical protein